MTELQKKIIENAKIKEIEWGVDDMILGLRLKEVGNDLFYAVRTAIEDYVKYYCLHNPKNCSWNMTFTKSMKRGFYTQVHLTLY